MAQVRLHLREAEGDLPKACMSCGEPATTTTSRTMSWCPSWVAILIVAGLLPYVIVALILTRRATLNAPFCDRHKGHWFNRGLLMWGSFFLFLILGIGSMVALANASDFGEKLMPIAGISCAVLFIAWIVIAIVAQNTMIRTTEITDREMVLEGVGSGFVDALAEADRDREDRRRHSTRKRWDDEEDEPAPRRKPRSDSSDHIQE